jgi:ribosomal protein S18 acetylase RimI-like enzyme
MEIRFAQIQDVPGILELLKQVGKVHHNLRPDLFRENAQKYSASGVLALLEDFDTPIFVAVEEDKVLGYCFCQLHRVEKDPVLKDNESLYIDDLCVEETCRGQQIGKQLFIPLSCDLIQSQIQSLLPVFIDIHDSTGNLGNAQIHRYG